MNEKRCIGVLPVLAAASMLAMGQTSVTIPGQTRGGDFGGQSFTRPARTVNSLPAGCTSGEVVALTSGAVGLYYCTPAGTWSAVVAHAHALTELSGVSGKQGSGTQLQAFGGGSVSGGDCAEFDAAGNVVSAHAPCAKNTANYSQSFSGQTNVILNHNLGLMNVLVGCFDAADETVIPDSMRIVSANQVAVTFSSPQSGRCVANATGGGSGVSGAGAVSSVFGRTGTVTAATGDYSFTQLSGTLALSQIANTALRGTGTKLQLFSGTSATNDCAKFDGSGNLVSAGAPCGSGSGAVTSVFGRTGAVTAATGDYSFAQVSGTAGLAQGGTNQTAWTAGRCVQVSQDGVRLESATSGCGSGGSGTIVTGLGLTGDGSAGAPLRVDQNSGLASQFAVTASLDFGSVPAQDCVERNITQNGVTAADTMVPGWPMVLPAKLTGVMFGAPNMVVVRLCNVSSAAVSVTAGLAYTARIIRSY